MAELERSLIDVRRIPKSNRRGIKQMEAHIRNVRNKLKAIHCGKEAWELERKYKWKSS